MKKICVILAIIICANFLSIKVFAATSSFKNNPINYQTSIIKDLNIMGIDRDYYLESEDEQYNKTDIIGIWEYYYDDGKIDLFIYLYNPYVGESKYNERVSLNEDDELEESYLISDNEKIKIENINMKYLLNDGQITKYVCQNPINNLRVGTYKKRTYSLRTYNSVVDYFNATFTNNDNDGESIDVSFEFNGYMFIFNKEAFKLKADLSQFKISLWDTLVNGFLYSAADKTYILPEIFSFNFDIPENYNVKNINSIDFSYQFITHFGKYEEGVSGLLLISPDLGYNELLNHMSMYPAKVDKKEVHYTKDDSVTVTGIIQNQEIEFNGLTRIDNNVERKNQKILNQKYIKTDLSKYYSYQYSLIFETSCEIVNEYPCGDIHGDMSDYTREYHTAKKMSITRMNYTDNKGLMHNVIVNQGAPVDKTTDIEYKPIHKEPIIKIIWNKIKGLFNWLFELFGANTMLKKLLVVIATILIIPLLPILIFKLIKSTIKIIWKILFHKKNIKE